MSTLSSEQVHSLFSCQDPSTYASEPSSSRSSQNGVMVDPNPTFQTSLSSIEDSPVAVATGVDAAIPSTSTIGIPDTRASQPTVKETIFNKMRSLVDPTNNRPDLKSSQRATAYNTAPIFSSRAGNALEQANVSPFKQFGLIGSEQHATDDIDSEHNPQDNLFFANMDEPWSAFICGSQGAGKSHTLSCLLENALLQDDTLGQLPDPLAAIVFHYDNYSSASCSQICEAAYLCSSGIPVTVLVSPSNIWEMTKLYTNLPGLPADAPRPKVLPLYLSEELLNISIMLKLMCVDPTDDKTPLYMESVMLILREMAMEGKGSGAFSYREFKTRLDNIEWVSGQLAPLKMRLQLLEAFLKPSTFTRTTRPAPATEDIWSFEPGTITLVDLSDPFVNSNDACLLFSICMSLFLEARGKSGRVIALDEAHKFLSQSGAARALTDDLTSVIRQQRHTGTRVLIATQEPTLSPAIIDLANVTFVHRFNSPAWYDVLNKHLAGAWAHQSSNSKSSLFETINNLETGHALLFCSTALMDIDSVVDELVPEVRTLGCEYARVKIRPRLTADGGRSITASETRSAKSLVSGARDREIPMHVVVVPPPSSKPRLARGASGKWTARITTDSAPSTSPTVQIQTPQSTLAALDQRSEAHSVTGAGTTFITSVTSQAASSGAWNSSNKPGQGDGIASYNPPGAPASTVTSDVGSSRSVPQSADQTLDSRVIHHARLCLRQRFQTSSWTKWNEARWLALRDDVEAAVGMRPGSLIQNPNLKRQFRSATKAEFAKCQSQKMSGK